MTTFKEYLEETKLAPLTTDKQKSESATHQKAHESIPHQEDITHEHSHTSHKLSTTSYAHDKHIETVHKHLESKGFKKSGKEVGSGKDTDETEYHFKHADGRTASVFHQPKHHQIEVSTHSPLSPNEKSGKKRLPKSTAKPSLYD